MSARVHAGSRRATAFVLLLLLGVLPGCMWRRHHVVMTDAAEIPANAEVLGEVEGRARFAHVFTLFASGDLHGTQGTLLSESRAGVLECESRIPVLDPLLRRVAAFVTGTGRVAAARRHALGRALEAAQGLGADTVVAPRFEVDTASLVFFVPLGFLHARGEVVVRAKAVRLGVAAAPAEGDGTPSGGAAAGG